MSVKFKYIITNIVAIAVYIIGMFLVELSMGSDNQFINGLQTAIANITIASPFVFYAIMTLIDVNINKRITRFGRYAMYTYFFIASIVFIFGIIKTIIWFINGTTSFMSGTWIPWNYNYIGVFIFTLLLSGTALVIGLATNFYIWLISTIILKIKKQDNKTEGFNDIQEKE